MGNTVDKWQALHAFWSSFDLPAYDQNSVPDNAVMPYITYEAFASGFEDPITISASIWYRSSSWEDISKKADKVFERLENYVLQPSDDGYLFIVKGSPFAQRLSEPNDEMVRRIYINIMVEFLMKY